MHEDQRNPARQPSIAGGGSQRRQRRRHHQVSCRYVALVLLSCSLGELVTRQTGRVHGFLIPRVARPFTNTNRISRTSSIASVRCASRPHNRVSGGGGHSCDSAGRARISQMIQSEAGWCASGERQQQQMRRVGQGGGRALCGFDTALRSSDSDDGMPDEAFESIFDKNAAILDVPLEMYDSSNVDLPTVGSKIVEMPVFMLDLAVCPGGVVPLHIFEMRYRQMMNDIGAKDNRFGMLVSDPETGTPCKYGAVLECAQRKLLPDGRQYLLNQAVERFRVLRVVTTKPYTVMQIEVGIPDDPYVEGEGARWGVAEGTSLAELEMQVFDTVNTVVELMNKLAPPMDVNEKRTLSEWFKTYAPKKTMDEGVEPLPEGDKQEHERRMKFSYAVAEMISMSPHTKQLLVQSRSTTYRLKAELEILMKAQKELAARCSLKDTLG